MAKCQFFVVQPPSPLRIIVTSDASETISCDIHNCVRRSQGEKEKLTSAVFANKSLNFFSRNKISSLWICVSKRVYLLRVYEQQQHNSLEKCFRNLFLLRLWEFTRAPPDFNTLMTSASTPLFAYLKLEKKAPLFLSPHVGWIFEGQ